jgi:hypothetical protein
MLTAETTRRTFLRTFLCLPLASRIAWAHERSAITDQLQELTARIPARTSDCRTGSQFARYVSKMDSRQREQAIRDEILNGNVPQFLRKLTPVQLHAGTPDGRRLTDTIFVMPDYLAIGSDDDFLRIPMNLHTAVAVADRFGCILPTKKMVDAIYDQARYHLIPQPLPAGPEMRSTEYYSTHNQMIEEQARSLGIRLGELISGDKKDVVITNLLFNKVGRIAIYGWHKGPGEPIQPLSTVHGANYADYSHGIRLVSETTLIDGKVKSVDNVLRDPSESKLLSDEGPIPRIWEFLSQQEESPTLAATSTN